MYVRVKRAKSDIGRIFMKVLVLNPGATSTKISIFEEENEVLRQTWFIMQRTWRPMPM